ncbi:hypothetical protein [Rhizobium phage RHph_X2_24]|nr:hypothetical protein [Rhizobium phage RHph_X2_24]
MNSRFVALQPKGLISRWMIWDTVRKEWVSNNNGWFRRFKTFAAANRAAKKMCE